MPCFVLTSDIRYTLTGKHNYETTITTVRVLTWLLRRKYNAKEVGRPACWSHSRRALFKMDSPTRRQLVVAFLSPAGKNGISAAKQPHWMIRPVIHIIHQSHTRRLSQNMFTPFTLRKEPKKHFLSDFSDQQRRPAEYTEQLYIYIEQCFKAPIS